MPIREILVLHHSHTDIGYTHPLPTLWDLERRFINEALDLCERSNDWPEQSRVRWTCETMGPVIHWLTTATDKQITRFRTLAKAGSISIGGMLCNITPCYSEEQIAQSLLAIRKLREDLQVPIQGAINFDVNGLPWPITQLFTDAGVELLIMGINVHFGGFPLHRPLAFKWRGSDNREIFAFNGETYGQVAWKLDFQTGSTDKMMEGWKIYQDVLEKHDYPLDFVYLSATHHAFYDNNSPDVCLAEMVKKWNDEGREPAIRFATPEIILQRLKEQAADLLPVHSGDWTDYWNFGSASSARETRLNRIAQDRLMAAQTLQARRMARGVADTDPAAVGLFKRSLWAMNFYDEHTWGADCSVTAPNSDNTLVQWGLKASFAYDAYAMSTAALRDELDSLSGNAKAPNMSPVNNVLFVNTSSVPRTDYVEVPNSWLEKQWESFSSSIHRLDVQNEFLGTDREPSRLVGPIDLAPNSAKVFAIDDLTEAVTAPTLSVADGAIESAYYRLTFDPKTGRVIDVFDKANQFSLIDKSSPWSFFGYVQETIDGEPSDFETKELGREQLFQRSIDNTNWGTSGWRTDWKSKRLTPTNLVSSETVVKASGVTLILKWEAPGVNTLEQRITLCASRPAIILEASFDKQDIKTPESLYFTLPCNLSNWRAHFDTGGLAVEFDAEQLPGVCRDWVTVGQWVSVHDDAHSITLACPDAPLVQIGDFNFGKMQTSVARDKAPNLLAWPVNNYWATNFRASQPGVIKVKYELASGGPFDVVAASTFGAVARGTIGTHPIIDGAAVNVDADDSPWISVSGDGVSLLHAKRAEDNYGVVVRLANRRDSASTATITLPGTTIVGGYSATTTEIPGQPITLAAGVLTAQLLPRSITTLYVRTKE